MSQESEVGGQRSEVGGRKSEVRGQKSGLFFLISDFRPLTSVLRPLVIEVHDSRAGRESHSEANHHRRTFPIVLLGKHESG